MIKPIITASFIDIMHPCKADGIYWNRKTLLYKENDWMNLVEHLHRDLGIETLILQNTTKDGFALYPSKIEKRQFPTACKDPVDAIFKACAREGVKLFAGPGWPGLFEKCFGETDKKTLSWYSSMFEEMLERYGLHDSFAGFYMCKEMHIFEDGYFENSQIECIGDMVSAAKKIAPDKKTLIASGIMPMEEGLGKTSVLSEQIKSIGIDIMLYMDGAPFF